MKKSNCKALVVCQDFGSRPSRSQFVSNFKWTVDGRLLPVISKVNSFTSIYDNKRKRISLLSFSQFRKQTGKGSISYLLYIDRYYKNNETIEEFNIYCEQLKMFHVVGGSGGVKESTSFNVGSVSAKNEDKTNMLTSFIVLH